MERLKYIKEALIETAYEHSRNLENVDTCELGEVIDMIKDIEKTLYYCTIINEMHESKQHKQEYEHHNEEVETPMLKK